MKYLYKPAALILFIVSSLCSRAQQMVQTPKDVIIICQKDNEFIGKPLKNLFKEIKPPIKMVFAEGGWAEQAPQFYFFFISKQGFDNYRQQGKLPLRLQVYVKEFFQWTYIGRTKNQERYLGWTTADEEKYGALTITAIRVAGEYEPCDDEPVIDLSLKK